MSCEPAVQSPDFLKKSGLSPSLGGNHRELKQYGGVFESEFLLLWAFGYGWVWMESGTLLGYCDVDLIAEASVGLL